MALEKQISQDFLQAFKGGDKAAVATLRLVKSVIQNKKIENKLAKDKELSDDDVVAVLKSEIKKRQDSIISYEQGGRADLVATEKAEILILNKYLPEQMSEAELIKIVQEVVASSGATGAADFGKIMGQVMGKTKGRSDGQIVSRLVKQELAK